MAVRNRNREIRRVRVGDLRRNPANHRRHPDGQRAALEGILQEVGYVGTLVAFQLPDGTHRLLDGHLRQDSLDDDDEVDVCIVDLEPEERRKILATHDAIGAMAEVDHAALEALIAEADVQSPALQAMLADLAECSLNGPADEGASLDESEAGPSGDSSSGSKEIPESWQVVAQCESEVQQREVYELLTEYGIKCRSLRI